MNAKAATRTTARARRRGTAQADFLPWTRNTSATKAVAAHNDFPEAGKGSGRAKLLEEPLSPPDPHTLDDEGTCEGDHGEEKQEGSDEAGPD